MRCTIAGRSHRGTRYPVVSISWNDAVTFCQKLSERPEEKRSGRIYRLPTEAEWEYFCRAGTTTLYATGDADSSLTPYAWYRESTLRPVGQKQSNPFGLYDVNGNVWEWCQDWRAAYPSTPTINPEGPSTGSQRIYRGGSFNGIPAQQVMLSGWFRAAYRGSDVESKTLPSLGFRLVCDIVKPEGSVSPVISALPGSLSEGLEGCGFVGLA